MARTRLSRAYQGFAAELAHSAPFVHRTFAEFRPKGLIPT